ncbi:MAG: penicillin-binding transpeptidase domain-containing protein [Breznakia sp.]
MVKQNRKRKKRKDSGRKSITFIAIITTTILSIVVCNVLFTMVTARHWRSGEDIAAKRESIKTKTVLANRGTIYDRDLNVIAQDVESYNLIAHIDPSRENATNDDAYVRNFDDAASKLAPILKTDAATIVDFFQNGAQNESSQVELGIYGRELTSGEKNQIEKLGIGGLEFVKVTSRVYPTGYFASQLIGYATKDEDGVSVGRLGLEQYFNKELTGTDGMIQFQTGSAGNLLPNSEKVVNASMDGANVITTISKDVQQVTEKAIRETMEANDAEVAIAIVTEIKTGKVLAQVGYPSFDLNDLNSINNYLNYPSEYAFEPGSILKPFFYAAAMDSGVYQGEATFQTGNVDVGLVDGYAVKVDSANAIYPSIHDAVREGVGVINFDESIVRSTNTGMVNLMSEYLNQDVAMEYLKKFGFGKKVGMTGVNEEAGQISVSNPLTKLQMSFGQGLTVTPYQLVQAGSAIFGNGSMVKPYLVDKVVEPSTNEVLYQEKTEVVGNPISEASAKQLQELLKRVVTDNYGTAHAYQMEDVTLMAKTGTGELVGENGYEDGKYTSSILAAAPAEDPQVLIYYGFVSKNYLNFSRDYFKDIVRESLDALHSYDAIESQVTINNETGNFREYTMPELVNHTQDYVNQKLRGFHIKKTIIGDGKTILKQFPEAGRIIISEQNIFLLSDGTNITMPNMTGWSRRDIMIFERLSGIGINFKGSGACVKQSIGEGTLLDKDTVVDIELK